MGSVRVKMICLAAAGIALPSEARAREEAVIVVTGERVPRRIFETSSSITVLTDDNLQALSGADRLDQVIALVPNLQLGSGGEGPTVRGQDSNGPLRDLPAFLGGTRPRVTLQVDGRPVSYNELAFGTAGLWEVSRIEVFRSPQTTTQGVNSIAGAIFIETAEPTFDWAARGRVVAGSSDLRQASAVLSGPLLAGELAFRASADIRRGRLASRISSIIAPQLDYGHDDYDNLRFRLLATPQALPGLRLAAIASRNRSSAPQIEGVQAPFGERRDDAATYGVFRQQVDAITLRGEYPFSTGWTAATTLTFGDASIHRLAPSGLGNAQIEASDWTGEVVLTWRRAAAVNVLAGINRTQASMHQDIDLRRVQLGVGEFRDRRSSLGVFGQIEWRFAHRLSLTAGARYQRDEQAREGTLGIGASNPLPLDFVGRSDRFLPNAVLAYDPSPGWRVGAMVQRAYNPGGVTLDGERRLVDTFAPETLWAYEAFARRRFFAGRLELSANVFHYDISDAQRTLTRELPTPGGTVTLVEIGNAPRARSSGGELQFTWRMTPELRLQGGVGVLLSREDLLQLCWDGRTVGDDAINRAIREVRRIAHATNAGFEVETVPRIGYRLAGVDWDEPPAESATEPKRLAVGRRTMLIGGAAVIAAAAAGSAMIIYRRRSDAVDGLIERGRFLQASGRPAGDKEAAALFRQALESDPGRADAWGWLSVVLDDYDQAREAAQRALTLDTKEPNARSTLAYQRRDLDAWTRKTSCWAYWTMPLTARSP